MTEIKRKRMTLVVLYNNGKILLGMKKRGFGAGRWNGYGGKVQEGETALGAALRELEEEAGISGVPITPGGLVVFIFPDGREFEVHLFRNSNFIGVASETEEMKPQWFNYSEIPFDTMWPDDKFWLPEFLKGKNANGKLWFADENTIVKNDIVYTAP